MIFCSAPDGYYFLKRGRNSILVRDDLVAKVEAIGLFRENDPSRWKGAAGCLWGGRGKLTRIELAPGFFMVVKVLRRGGLIRWFTRDCHFSRKRLFHEALLSNHLLRRKVPIVPMLLGRAEYKGIGFYRLQLGTLEFKGATSLLTLIKEGSADERMLCEVMEQAGRTVGALHDAGVFHHDLNLGNLLVGPPDSLGEKRQVLVIDLDRSKRKKRLSSAARIVNLARLYRHGVKNGLFKQVDWMKNWRCFLAGYCGGAGDAALLEKKVEKRYRSTLLFHRISWALQGK